MNGHTKVLTRCLACGHEWETVPSTVNHGRGCPKCAGKLLSQEEWRARYQKVGLDLLEDIKTNVHRVDTRCQKCGHEWKSIPNNVQQGRGCPECKRISASEWEERAALVGIRWIDIPRDARTQSRAECLECGREWLARPSAIAAGHGCDQCAARRQGEKRRRPQAAWEARYAERHLELLEPVETKRINVRTRCLKCDYTWQSYPQSIWNGSGCPACADYGFTPSDPAMIYVLQSPRDGALKVGIANTPKPGQASTRLTKHRRNGWDVLRTWDVDTGTDAYAIEQACLYWWRNTLGLGPGRTRGDGWTETVSGDEMTIRRVVQFINKQQRAILTE